MLPSKKPVSADEELGKKDDDHRPHTERGRGRLWPLKQCKTLRRRRILLVAIGLYMVYLFFRNMPTDLVPAAERYNPVIAQARKKGPMPSLPSIPSPAIPQHGPPPRDAGKAEGDTGDFYYDGPIKFYALPKTLRQFENPAGRSRTAVNRDIVFAGSNLRAVSDLLPLACKMASQKLSRVHFVLMGRDDVSAEGIQGVNGIDPTDCPVIWHGRSCIH
jgi:hypothetical protein